MDARIPDPAWSTIYNSYELLVLCGSWAVMGISSVFHARNFTLFHGDRCSSARGSRMQV